MILLSANIFFYYIRKNPYNIINFVWKITIDGWECHVMGQKYPWLKFGTML